MGSLAATGPPVWQLVLLAALAIGALAVLAAARRWGGDADVARSSVPALVAQYRRIATRGEQVVPTDEEIAYQVAALRALRPHLREAIAATRDEATRAALRSIEAAGVGLRDTLKAAKRTGRHSVERDAVPLAAQVLGEAARGARELLDGAEP